MPIGSVSTNLLPAAAKGKSIESVEVSQDEGSLYLNLRLEDGLAIELSFAVAYHHNVSLVQWENGDSRVLEGPGE
jgi:hypothetical protein